MLLLNLRAKKPSGVEDDPDGLAAFDFKEAGDELVAARRGGPANVAHFVAGTIIAKALEFAALTALAPAALFHFHLAAAD